MKTWNETVKESKENGIREYKIKLKKYLDDYIMSDKEIDNIIHDDITINNAIRNNLDPELLAYILAM